MAERDDWRAEAERVIESATSDDLPAIAGDLARLDTVLQLRLRAEGGYDGNGLGCLSADQVARLLGNADRSWVYRHADRLGGRKIGGRLLFPESALRRVLDGR